jgi:hypothetical protein
VHRAAPPTMAGFSPPTRSTIQPHRGLPIFIGEVRVRPDHFTIVGSAEASPREGRISNESPVGSALMGLKKGDKFTVNAPQGPIEYTLVRIG